MGVIVIRVKVLLLVFFMFLLSCGSGTEPKKKNIVSNALHKSYSDGISFLDLQLMNKTNLLFKLKNTNAIWLQVKKLRAFIAEVIACLVYGKVWAVPKRKASDLDLCTK